LDGDRADTTGAANDQDGRCCARHELCHVQPVEHSFPRREGRQRHGGGFCPAQRLGLVADHALVNKEKLAVGAGPTYGADVEYLAAAAEQRGLWPGGDDNTCGVPAQDLPLPWLGSVALADFRIHRVD